MKNYLFIVFSIFLFSVSCTNDKNQDLSQAQLMDIKMSENQERPAEIVPSDHPIQVQLMRNELNWEEMHIFYNENLDQYQDEAYYDNLLHMKSLLIQYKGIEDLTGDKQKSFLDELLALDRTSGLRSVAEFIASNDKLTAEEKSYYASAFLSLNKKHLESSSSDFRDKMLKQENYKMALEILEKLIV